MLYAPALVLVLTLALGACGGDGKTSTPAKLETDRLHKIKRLKPAEFRAIERVFSASLPLNKLSGSATTTDAQLDAALRPMLAACDDIDAGHPLLGVLRSTCPPEAAFYRTVTRFGRCGLPSRRCLDPAQATVRALRDLVDASRRSDRAVRATRLPQACRRVLVTPKAVYRFFAEFDTATEGLAIALDAGSDDDVVDAVVALGEVDTETGTGGRSTLRRFRAHCR